MLTGTYPFNHGVRWLVKYRVKNRMVQEVLKEKGFRTAAFIGGFPLTQGDLDRGFDIFKHEPLVEDRNEGRSHFVPINILVQDAVNFLNEKDEDAFVFIHVFDGHFTLRSEFDVNHEPPEKDENGRYKDIQKHLGRRERRYREEIDFMARNVQRLLELSEIDLLVITGDHGEKMQGEKDYPWVFNHKGEIVGSHFHEVELFDVQLKVPLLVHGKGIMKKRIIDMVRTVDIMPTILDFLKIDISTSDIDGFSLMPIINGNQKSPVQTSYSETYFAQMHEENKHADSMKKKFKWGWNHIDNLVSIRTNDQKLICLANGRIEPLHFFDLTKDPEEENDLVEMTPIKEDIEELLNKLKEMLKNDNQYSQGSFDTEKSKIKRLLQKRSNKIIIKK
jgi:arylsulfatase A-like enzyme